MTDLPQDYAVAEEAWGDHEPEPWRWSSGAWSLEVRGDELADIRFDGTLILRSVRTVVRVRDWITVPTTVEGVDHDKRGLLLTLSQRGYGAAVSSTLRVSSAAGLTIRLDAIADQAFDRNRLGLIVLHPPALAGMPLEVTAPDATVTSTSFPDAISPHQPATDIAGLAWSANGVRATLLFGGDVFEMEDQRNWTDASYKTYSTPLALPFPVRLEAGTAVQQSITITADRLTRAGGRESSRVRLEPTGRRMPQIIAGASTALDATAPPAAGDAAPVLLVELDMRAANWRAALHRAAQRGVPLDVRIAVRTDDDLPDVLDALAPLPVIRLGVFGVRGHVTEQGAWKRLLAELASRDLAPELVGGSRAHFTELNRTQHALQGELSALTFSITPQMHAVERAQLVESISMQELVARDARRIAGDRPLHIGPITLRSRFNDVASSEPAPEPGDVHTGYGPERIAQATDPRQTSRALAAWTVASVAALAAAGPQTICYYEESGPRGAVDLSGQPYPVAEALRMLRSFESLPVLTGASGIAGVHLFGVVTDSGTVVVGANLTARAVSLSVEDDRPPIEIAPFGVRVDFPPTA